MDPDHRNTFPGYFSIILPGSCKRRGLQVHIARINTGYHPVHHYSLGFSAYANNFGQWNKLYGSIGTLIVIMIWLYLNSLALLVGFELNVSIKAATAELNGKT
jgi:hypothetical protein